MTDKKTLDAQKHTRFLLHALHAAHPVMHQGKQQFIHTLLAQQSGGSTSTTIHLTGNPAALDAADVQLREQTP
jgi:hypothetical protein